MMLLIDRLLSQAVWNADAGAGAAGGDAAGAAAPALQQRASEIAGAAGAGGGGNDADDGADDDAGNEQDQAARGESDGDGGEAGAGGAEPYRPDGLAEDLRGETDQQTIDRLVEKLNSQPTAPEKPEGYQLDLTEEQKARYGDLDKDPVHVALREVLHGEDIPNEKFQNIFTKMHDRMTEMGVLETVDPAAELAKLAPRSGDQAERDSAAGKRVTDATQGIKDLGSTLKLTQEQTNLLLASVDTAESVVAWEKVLGATRGRGVKPGGGKPSNQQNPRDKALATLYPTHSKGT